MLVMVFGVTGILSAASAPNIITYQGRILNSNGVPVSDASLAIVFALYDASTDGTCVWSNSSASCATTTTIAVSLTSGLFTENLGDTDDSYAAIGDSIFSDNATLYLEVIVAGETLTPRKRITAAPYALNADTLDGIDSSSFLQASGGDLELTGSLSVGDGAPNRITPDDEEVYIEGALEVDGAAYFDNRIAANLSSATDSFINLTSTGDFIFYDNGTAAMTIDDSGDVTLAGGLAVNGDDITSDGNLEIEATGYVRVGDSGVPTTASSDDDLFVTDDLEVDGIGRFDLGASDYLLVNAASFDSTTTTGALSIYVDSETNNNRGIFLDYEFLDDDDGTDTGVGMFMNLYNTTADDGDTIYGIHIDQVTSNIGTDALIRLENSDTDAADAVINAILIDGAGAITDAIDAADSDIENALHIDANFIRHNNLRTAEIDINTLTWEDVSGNDLMTLTDNSNTGDLVLTGDLAVNGDDITSDGNLDIIATTYVGVGSESPSSATGAGDLFVSDAIEIDGLSYLKGQVQTSSNVLATLDGTEQFRVDITGTGSFLVRDGAADIFVLDDEGAVTFTLDSIDDPAFTITNNGSSNVTTNLASTGDFVIQDNGTPAFTVDDSGDVTLAGDLAVNGDDITSDGDLTINPAGGQVSLADGDTLNIGGTAAGQAYNVIGDSVATASGQTDSDDDLYIEGDLEVDGLVVFQGSQFQIDALPTTATTGVIDVDISTVTAGVEGLNIYITQSDGSASGADVEAINLTLAANDADGDMFGIDIVANATDNAAAGSYEALIRLSNTEPTASTVTDALLVTTSSGTSGDIVDAVDASAGDITNALNAGSNFVLFNGTRAYSSSSTVLVFEDTAGNDLMTVTDAGTTGNLAVSGSLAVTGNLVASSDVSCTDCLDFPDFEDTLDFDSDTQFTQNGTETLTFSNQGTGAITFDLTSTGDFIVADDGTPAFTVNDSGNATFAGDLTVSGTLSGVSDIGGTTATTFTLDTDSSGVADQDLYFYFEDDEAATAHYLGWDDGLDSFLFNDEVSPATAGTPTLGLTTNEWDGLYIGDDGVGVTFGAGQEFVATHNSTDSIMSFRTAQTASLDTDTAIYTFAADTANAGMTASSEVFEIGYGDVDDSAANWTELFSVREDGDVQIGGNRLTTNGITSMNLFNENVLTASVLTTATDITIGAVAGTVSLQGDLAVNGDDITSDGDLTIDAAGGQVLFADGDVFNIGGASGVAYNVIGDNTDNVSGTPNSDDDLYIEGNIEVDGAFNFDSSGSFEGPVTIITGALRVNSDSITSDSNLDISATGYVRIGDTGTPGVANGDDDLYVEGGLEVDGETELDGALDADGQVDLGDNGDTVAINSSDWDIGTDGTITGVDFDANGSGNSLSNVDAADITDDSLDFTEFDDSMSLDAALTVLGGAGETITWSRTLTNATAEKAMTLNVTPSDSTGATTEQYGLYIDNTSSLSYAVDALLVIDNSHTSDSDDVGAGIRFESNVGDFLYGIDMNSATVQTSDIRLSNGETISNTADGTIAITATDTTISGNLSVDGNANPANAGQETLGTTALEWDGLFVGDDGVGVTWGAGQDLVAAFDNASDSLEFIGSLVSIGAEADNTTATGDNDLFVVGDFEVNGATDLDGNLLVADTDIAFDGASTTFTTTGAFTLTPGGATLLGDGVNTMQINSSDWDIGTDGTITGVDFDANGTENSLSNVDAADITDDSLTFAQISDSSAIDTDTTFTAADGVQLTLTPTHTNGDTNFFTINADQTDDGDGTDDFYAIKLDLTSESGDTGDTFRGIGIEWEEGTANTVMDAAIRIDNEETTDSTITDAIIITSSGVEAGVVDALDASDSNITNALNIGTNNIVFDTMRQYGSSSTVLTWDDGGNTMMTLTDNSNEGDLVITGDLTADDFSCTSGDCLDFTELSDTMALDTATSITGTAGETFTFTRTGTAAASENGVAIGMTIGLLDGMSRQQNGLEITVTNEADHEGSTNIITGLNVAALGTADAEAWERGIQINAGWDHNILFNDTTTNIGVADGGTITWNDNNSQTLMTLTDDSDEGDLVVTGSGDFDELTVDENGLGIDVAAAGQLTIGGTNATTISICNSADCAVVDIATNASADNIYLGDVADTVAIRGAAGSYVNFPYFDIAANTNFMTFTPNTTGTVLDFDLETEWTTGDLINADWDSSTAMTGTSVTGIDLDFTNATATQDVDWNGINVKSPSSTSLSGNTTTNLVGFNIPSAATLDTTGAAGDTTIVSWIGNQIYTPDIDTGAGETNDVVTSVGIAIMGGTVTNGGGTENQYGITFGNIQSDIITGNGEELDVTAGDGSGAAGGALDFNAGAGAATYDGGAATMNAGDGGIASDGVDVGGEGGGVTIAAGNGGAGIMVLDAGDGGALTISSGTGGARAMAGTGAGGLLTISAGDAGSSATAESAAGGSVLITAGDGEGTGAAGDGGSITLNPGDAESASGQYGAIVLEGAIDFGTQAAFADGDTDPSVEQGSFFRTVNTNPVGVTITNFDDGVAGQIIFIENVDTYNTIFSEAGATISLGTNNITTGSGDFTVWMFDGSVWHLVSYMPSSANNSNGDGFDVAEWYPASEDVVPGEVVIANSNSSVEVKKSSAQYQTALLGVVSTQPGLILGSEGESTFAAQVALAGRVPVKATNENGAIKVGDYLTSSSVSGHAMKATKAGPVVGMALEDFNEATGTVLMHVSSGWYAGGVIGTDGTSTLITDNAVMAPLGIATEETPDFDSYGLSLRGSAWNGAEAVNKQMTLVTDITNADSYRLSVRDTIGTEVAYITNEGTMSISGDMVIAGKLYPSDRGVAQTEKYIYYDGSSGPGGDFMRTNASGWSTGSYDFAEMFPSNQALLAGEVVAFSGDGINVSRSLNSHDSKLAGIVSTRPGFLAGENLAGNYPVALAGRVPTKVVLENGVIEVGDALTSSSTPGSAMKATESGMIIGYALEPYTGSQNDDRIVVFVNVGYFAGESLGATPGAQNTASEFAQSFATSYTSLNMSGNIYMTGNEILSIGKLAGISDNWSIDQDGTMKTKSLLKTVITSHQGTQVETIAVTSPEAIITLSGTTELKDGQAEVRFEKVIPEYNDVISAWAPIRVVVTPMGPVSLYVEHKDQNGFIVKRFGGNEVDVEFDWMVTAYRKGFEPEEDVEEIREVEDVREVEEEVAPGFSLGEEVREIEKDEPITEEEKVENEEEDSLVPLVESDPLNNEEVVLDDPAPQVSPDETPVDPLVQDDGGILAEQPSEPVSNP